MRTNGETLRLNENDKRFLGVCAGFARYMDVPAVAVRLIYVVACLVWPTLIIVYFVTYWCLKPDQNPGKIKSMVTESKTAEHFKKLDFRRPLYRNPHDAKIAGVCSGFADYLDVNPFIVRLLTFLSLFIFGPFTFWAYVVCWMVMQKRPADFEYPRSRTPEEQMVVDGQVVPTRSLDECSSLLRSTENRLRDVEAFITSKQFRLHCEINRI